MVPGERSQMSLLFFERGSQNYVAKRTPSVKVEHIKKNSEVEASWISWNEGHKVKEHAERK